MHDLENKKLVSSGDKKYGNFENKVKLNNAFFETQDLKVKILGYIVKYYIAKPYIHNTEIDLSANILGVVENIQKGTKQTVLNDGSVQMEWLFRSTSKLSIKKTKLRMFFQTPHKKQQFM
mgnify:CR=1 FL=1